MACGKTFEDIVTYTPAEDGSEITYRHQANICEALEYCDDDGDVEATLRTCGDTACRNYVEVPNV